jgi:chromate reductase, NAD(P)H dehydrogenase (quinone)
MKYIISGTNRPGSRSMQVATIIQELYREEGEETKIVDLQLMDLPGVVGHYGDSAPDAMKSAIQEINSSDGVIVVVPEYNGSYPGALKYFIDHWSYPHSFEWRPVCFIGLGWGFGGLRPVEHLQSVFGYRNAFIYPDRVFLVDAPKYVNNGKMENHGMLERLRNQVKGFQAFTKALTNAGLDANSIKARSNP